MPSLLLIATALTGAVSDATPFGVPIADVELQRVTPTDAWQHRHAPAPDHAGPSLRILTGDQMDVWWGTEGAELIAELWQPRSGFTTAMGTLVAANANGGIDVRISLSAATMPIASGTSVR